MFRRSLLLALLAIPTVTLAQKKEIAELQRDVAALQDQVRNLQQSFDKSMGALTVLVQQITDASKDVSKEITALQVRFNDRLAEQTKNVAQPVAVLGTKVDQMSTDFQAVQSGMNDLLARMGKLEQKIVDLGNAVRTMQPAPPPPSTGPTTPAGGTGAPPVPADTLYGNAYRDMMGNKRDLALQGFTDYLKYYANTEYAPNAQFWIGQIYYEQGELENALKAFDAVLTEYDENTKTPDALLMKGRTLLRMGRRTPAVETFRTILADHPKKEAAPKACQELKTLGLSCTVPGSKKKGR